MSKETDSQINKIQKWIEEQGYPLEMRISQVCERVGFEVSHFEHFLDPQTQEPREIDVVASRSYSQRYLHLEVSLLIECKYAVRNPWIILKSRRSSHPFVYFSRQLDGNTDIGNWQRQKSFHARLLARVLQSLGTERIKKELLFSMPSMAGYNMIEAFRSAGAKDNAYRAIMQIGKCAEAYDLENLNRYDRSIDDFMERLESEPDVARPSFICRIAFPIIVLQGNLFECYPLKDDISPVQKISHGLLYVSSKGKSPNLGIGKSDTIIHVVTEDHFEEFAAAAYKSLNLLVQQKKPIDEIVDFEAQSLVGSHGTNEIPF